jgi:hypothetical protein
LQLGAVFANDVAIHVVTISILIFIFRF